MKKRWLILFASLTLLFSSCGAPAADGGGNTDDPSVVDPTVDPGTDPGDNPGDDSADPGTDPEDELKDEREAALAIINAIDISQLSDENKEEAQDLIDLVKESINNATTKEQIDSMINYLNTKIKAIKLTDKKEKALIKIDLIDKSEYPSDKQEYVEYLISVAKASVGSATSEEQIDSILSELYKKLEDVKQGGSDVDPTDPGDDPGGDDPTVDPGTDPVDPGDEPGGDDPGTDPVDPGDDPGTDPETPEEDPMAEFASQITTKQVENLKDDFIFGMDASSVISLEDSGVSYVDYDKKTKDVFEILSEFGVNYIRVRVWNDPYDSSGHGYGGGNNDIDKAVAIGKRATKYGMKLLVDFHYSDFWADPVKQSVPKAWSGYTLDQKKAALYQFTKDSLNTLKDNEVDVGMVQVGNETNSFLCGEKDWANVIALMSQGSKAVREVYDDALVAVHFTNPEKGRFPSYAQQLYNNNLDYDVFGTSYYPYWHGTLDNLSSTLNYVATHYNKKVMVMETSYAFDNVNYDQHTNTSPKDSDTKPHEISVQGQYDQVYDVIETINNTTNGIGVCYWEGTWVGVGTDWTSNSQKWEKYGSGWASSYANEYDPDDAGKYYGGCAVENQAFFDSKWNVLPSLLVFKQKETTSSKTEDVTEYIINGDFETSTDGWTCSPLADTFKINDKAYKTGSSSLNVWCENASKFSITQTVSLPAGKYVASCSIMGACDSYAIDFLIGNGVSSTGTYNLVLDGWENWNDYSFEFEITVDTEMTIELYVDFKAAGGWFYFDNVSLVNK